MEASFWFIMESFGIFGGFYEASQGCSWIHQHWAFLKITWPRVYQSPHLQSMAPQTPSSCCICGTTRDHPYNSWDSLWVGLPSLETRTLVVPPRLPSDPSLTQPPLPSRWICRFRFKLLNLQINILRFYFKYIFLCYFNSEMICRNNSEEKKP